MSSLAKISTDELRRSSPVAHFLSLYNVGSKRPPSTGELRQLRDELERILSRAAARAAQAARCQPNTEVERSGHVRESPGRKRTANGDAWLPDSGEAAASTPNSSGPAGKRAKPARSGTLVGGSDSEKSINAGTSQGAGGSETPQQSSADPLAATASPKAKHSAGTPVQDDFSRVKVTNQVQIQTYWAAMEPYFRNITEEDLALLEPTAEDPETLAIPPLGKFYAYKWAEEELAHFPDHMHHSKTRHAVRALIGADSHAKSRPDALTGSGLAGSELSPSTARLAPLTERIVSALVAERLVLADGSQGGGDASYRSDSEGSDTEIEPRQLSSSGEPLSLEDRMKRELRYIGILDDDDVNWDDRQDDEVCVTIRALQRQLREQRRINHLRMERLLPAAKEHSGYQEYTQVIDELDKQVEQSYLKRHRQTKSRKRKSAPVKTVSLSDNALNAMGRRRRVIQAIGHLFPEQKFALPSESIYKGIPQNPVIQMK
ncbi:Transcriptional regulator [Coemansia guatemalensis]|uniref:Transcriptional regulator n=1 Tax=Coemansia guatemalensis TaxID=2761395 RepID=A0A9W8HUR1_9FUNG|nr:Transcriptional regulator [Coemansia guatemalensis]